MKTLNMEKRIPDCEEANIPVGEEEAEERRLIREWAVEFNPPHAMHS